MKLRNNKEYYSRNIIYRKRTTKLNRQQLMDRIVEIVLNNKKYNLRYMEELELIELIAKTFDITEIYSTWNKSNLYILNRLNKIHLKSLLKDY